MSLKDARNAIDKNIILRGNLDLGFLLNAGPDEVKKESLKILREVEGYKHIIFGSCEVVYGTPMKNLLAMSEAVEEYNNSNF